MQFNTDLYYVQHSGFGTKNFRARKHKAHWCLWFTEEGFYEDRQNVVMSWQFPVKPTKKQIRKLRRQFRNENKILKDSIVFDSLSEHPEVKCSSL